MQRQYTILQDVRVESEDSIVERFANTHQGLRPVERQRHHRRDDDRSGESLPQSVRRVGRSATDLLHVWCVPVERQSQTDAVARRVLQKTSRNAARLSEQHHRQYWTAHLQACRLRLVCYSCSQGALVLNADCCLSILPFCVYVGYSSK